MPIDSGAWRVVVRIGKAPSRYGGVADGGCSELIRFESIISVANRSPITRIFLLTGSLSIPASNLLITAAPPNLLRSLSFVFHTTAPPSFALCAKRRLLNNRDSRPARCTNRVDDDGGGVK